MEHRLKLTDLDETFRHPSWENADSTRLKKKLAVR